MTEQYANIHCFLAGEGTGDLRRFALTVWRLSKPLTSRVKIRCSRASKEFENLNIFRCFSAMDTRWTLKLGQREVNLSVWPSPEFERD